MSETVVCDNTFSIYANSRDLDSQLPYRSDSKGVEISGVDVCCSECDEKLEGIRGILTEWPNCIELRGWALCPDCMTIIRFSTRWYADSSGAVPGGWVPMKMVQGHPEGMVKKVWRMFGRRLSLGKRREAEGCGRRRRPHEVGDLSV